jgi:hypothetical protein
MNSRWLLRVGCLGLAACAVSANLGGTEQPIGGQLAGLTPGETITLQDNLGDNLTLSSNGAFTFPTSVANGEMYSVTILTSPSSPIAQTCTLSNPAGVVQTSPITNVAVQCDMLAYFPFSGNANDASGYGNDGVVAGASPTTDRNGDQDSAYAFSAIGSIQAAMPPGFLPSGDSPRTLTAWMQPTASTSMLGVVYWGSGNCTGVVYGLGDSGDRANFWGGCDDFRSTLAIPVGVWTFVAITYTPAFPKQITFYVNGQAETAPIVSQLDTSNTGPLVMGADLVAGTSFTGSLDSIRVYGHALNAAEMMSVFSSSDP